MVDVNTAFGGGARKEPEAEVKPNYIPGHKIDGFMRKLPEDTPETWWRIAALSFNEVDKPEFFRLVKKLPKSEQQECLEFICKHKNIAVPKKRVRPSRSKTAKSKGNVNVSVQPEPSNAESNSQVTSQSAD